MLQIAFSVFISFILIGIVLLYVLPYLIDKHIEDTVTEYVKEAIILSETRIRELIDKQQEQDIKPIYEALKGYYRSIQELGEDIDQLYSEGQSQKRNLSDLFEDEPLPKS